MSVPQRLELGGELLLHVEPGMVGRERYSHGGHSSWEPAGAIIRGMRITPKWLAIVGLTLASMASVAALQTPPQTPPQTPQPQAPAQQTSPQKPTFRVAVDLVTTDVIARDGQDQFIADLKTEEFEVFEDGVKQEIASLVLDARRPRVQRAGAAAGAGAGRHHPAGRTADQRHGRPRLPALHRRPAPRLPQDAAHARPDDSAC